MPHGIIVKHVSAASEHISATFLERLAEWTFAAVLFSWGLILMRPEQTFGISPSSAPLARIADESTWAFYCASVGGLRLLALFVNGWLLPHTYVLRIATSFLSVLAWLTISLGLMASGTANTGIAVYPWILIAEFVCLYRTGRDYARWRDLQAATPGA